MTGRLKAVGRLPVDVFLVVATLVIVHAAMGLGPGSPLRVALMLVFLLLIPGYALSTAVFPAKRVPDRRRQSYPRGPAPGAALDTAERAAVSFGLSLVLLPLLGLGLAVLSWPVTAGQVIDVFTVFVVATLAIGTVRRLGLPDEERYDLPIRGWVRGIGDGHPRPLPIDTMLNVGVAVAVLLASGTLAVAVVAPPDGTTYTDMALLSPGDDGDLVAAGYPTNFTRNEGKPLVLEVTNHEDREVHYTVIVRLERIEGNRITETAELHRFDRPVPPAGTWQIRHTVSPPFAGEELRLLYLLYEDDPPENPQRSNAYRHTYLWINVTAE